MRFRSAPSISPPPIVLPSSNKVKRKTRKISKIHQEDPFDWFAQADGYTDGERWWNDKVEERANSTDFFASILEAITALRGDLERPESRQTLLREAWMRRQIRKAQKDGFQNIAVVCGAWHTPALATMPTATADNSLLKGLPKVKVDVTWAPWTYARLTTRSGYGAGVRSPGWYDHLWGNHPHPIPRWLVKAARELRKQDLEGSSASIIEATRLAESLSGIRGRPRPGLDESLETIQTVFCNGDPTPLALLDEPLLIGKTLGSLPEATSTLPLQKRYRGRSKTPPPQAHRRSQGSHPRPPRTRRAQPQHLPPPPHRHPRPLGNQKDRAQQRNLQRTLATPVGARTHPRDHRRLPLRQHTRNRRHPSAPRSPPEAPLSQITSRLDDALLSDLGGAAEHLLDVLDQAAAVSSETTDLLDSVAVLVRIARYGDVRETDTKTITRILGRLAARAHIELPAATSGINDEASAIICRSLRSYTAALATFDEADLLADFHLSPHQDSRPRSRPR